MLYYKKNEIDNSFTLSVSEMYEHYSGTTYSGMTMKLHNDANGRETTLPLIVSDYNSRYIITSLDLDDFLEGNYTCSIYYGAYLLKVDRLLIYTTLDVYKD